MASSALDDTDRRLLRVLQADGRITNAELAKQCNLSPAATFDRVRRLRERGYILGYVALLDPAKIFLVQLADFMWQEIRSVEERITTARHFRVFPGEGVHSEALADLVTRLYKLGYRGDYSFEVFNDDYQQLPLDTVAARAWRCASWLGEDVLRRTVPLPNQMKLRQRGA